MDVDWKSVTRCRLGGVIGEGVGEDNGIPGHHVVELRCDVFLGSSLEVLGFLVKLEIVFMVVGLCGLECGWEGFWHARSFGGCHCPGVVGGSRCLIGDELLRRGRGC